MSTDKTIVLVTGRAGKGKSTLLFRLADRLRRTHRLGGFVMRGEGRNRPDLFGAAERYELCPVAAGEAPMLWADRDGEACVFRDETRMAAERLVSGQLALAAERRPEVMFIDEIGRLELKGKGFASLFRKALAGPVPVLVVSLKKKALQEIVESFGLESALLVDLDQMDAAEAERTILRKVRSLDGERIGAFAGLSGLVEVGLGSTLRALRVPLKGHVLAYLQNVLLVTFGKALHGRGLFRISFISAMLKAFSPVGGTIRPMLYILLQGGAFCLPVALVGFNLAGVLAGSVLMAWMTLAVKLLLDWAVFGMAFFDAFAGVVGKVGEWASVRDLSLGTAILFLFALKTILAVAMGAVAYYGDMEPLVRRLRVRPKWAVAPRRDALEDVAGAADASGNASAGAPVGECGSSPHASSDGRKATVGRAALGALRDLLNWKFALFFLLSVLLMMFFANLETADLVAVAVRGLCISYVGFLALRSVDFLRLGRWMDDRFGLGMGDSLPKAMEALASGSAETALLSTPEAGGGKHAGMEEGAKGIAAADECRDGGSEGEGASSMR